MAKYQVFYFIHDIFICDKSIFDINIQTCEKGVEGSTLHHWPLPFFTLRSLKAIGFIELKESLIL